MCVCVCVCMYSWPKVKVLAWDFIIAEGPKRLQD